MTTVSGGVSRRTLMKGAAWSVPAIAVAVAAPMAAASGTSVVGDFYESSAIISTQSVGLSAIFVKCASDTNEADWKGKMFDATVTVEYTGSNPDFSFADAVNQGYWTMAVSPDGKSITFAYSKIANGCSEGAFQFPTCFVAFNAAQADPGADSIRVTATAVCEDGSFSVGQLIDATPNSPTFGSTPVGPRDTSLPLG